MSKQEFATLVLAMLAMYGDEFIGTGEAMESFDEVTRESVKRLGFQNICLSENIVADRARFAEIYPAIQQRKRTDVNIGSALPDLQKEVHKRLGNLEQKEQKALVQENYIN